MPDSTIDPKSIARKEKSAKLFAQQDSETLTRICATEAGRRWIWDRLTAAHMFTTTFASDPHQTAFNEGNRNQGLLLLNQLMQHCPDQFILMMRESNGRRYSTDTARSSNDDAGGDSAEPADTYDTSDPS